LKTHEKREIFEQESYNFFESDFNIEKNIFQLENIYNKVKKNN
jgi:hypothetical protein